MPSLEPAVASARLSAALALLLCALVAGRSVDTDRPRRACGRVPNPCDLPVVGNVCDAVGSAAGSVASAPATSSCAA